MMTTENELMPFRGPGDADYFSSVSRRASLNSRVSRRYRYTPLATSVPPRGRPFQRTTCAPVSRRPENRVRILWPARSTPRQGLRPPNSQCQPTGCDGSPSAGSTVLAVFLRVVNGWYRRQAKAMGIADGRCGSVTLLSSVAVDARLVHSVVLRTLPANYRTRQEPDERTFRCHGPPSDLLLCRSPRQG